MQRSVIRPHNRQESAA